MKSEEEGEVEEKGAELPTEATQSKVKGLWTSCLDAQWTIVFCRLHETFKYSLSLMQRAIMTH